MLTAETAVAYTFGVWYDSAVARQSYIAGFSLVRRVIATHDRFCSPSFGHLHALDSSVRVCPSSDDCQFLTFGSHSGSPVFPSSHVSVSAPTIDGFTLPSLRTCAGIHAALGFRQNVNDPSAGSPTDTLLRLLLPLNGRARRSFQPTSRRNLASRANRSEGLARSFNR